MTEQKHYSGIDLLDKIFEFTEMTPDQHQWNLTTLKSNPPRYIRLQQIESLINAFFQQESNTNFFEKAKAFFSSNTKFNIQSILSGQFIIDKPIKDYDDMIFFMKKIVIEKEKQIDESREIHIRQLIMPYQQLINFKKLVRSMLTFNSGWLESSSVTSRFSIYLTNSISENIIDKYSDLDKALELFINPRKLSFTEKELKEKYKFPQNNLDQVDMDHI